MAEKSASIHPFWAKIGHFFSKTFHFLAGILLFLDDLFVLAGLGIVIYTNYRVNWLIGMYSLGSTLILTGLLIGWRLGKIKKGGK